MKKKLNKKMMIIWIAIFFIISGLSGCVDELKKENQEEEDSVDPRFIGTWIGNLIYTSNKEKGVVNITELIFIKSTVDVTMESNWGNKTITYNYKIEGDKLILETTFDKGGKTSSTTYSYSFNDEYAVLYIDGSEFIKTN